MIVYDKASADTLKARILVKLSALYADNNDAEEARIYGQKALALTQKIRWGKGIAMSYNALGRTAYIVADYHSSADYQKLSIQVAKQNNDAQDQGPAYLGLAVSYLASSDKKRAIGAYEESIKYLSEKSQSSLMVFALTQAAQLYHELNDDGKAIDYYLRAKKIGDKSDNDNIKEMCSFYLSGMYNGLEEYDRSLSYALDALKYFKKQGETGGKDRELLILDKITVAYTFLKDYEHALQYGNRALTLANKLKVAYLQTQLESNIAWAWYNLGNFSGAYLAANDVALSTAPEVSKLHVYNTMGCILRDAPDSILKSLDLAPAKKYQDAIGWFQRSIKSKNRASREQNCLDLSITYERMNKPVEAYAAYKHYVALRDSSHIDEDQKMLLKKETQFEADKAEDSLKYTQQLSEEKLQRQSLLATQRQQALLLNAQQLRLANKQKDIERLNFLRSQASLRADDNWRKANMQQLKASQKDRALAQATVLLQKVEIRSRNDQVYYFLAGIAALLLLLVFIGLNYYNQRRSNGLLFTANKVLGEQREEIITQRDHLSETVEELRSTQNQLIQSEKMASLGELTAGIAHEIQNPLNFVNNFSGVSAELMEELQVELEKGDMEEAKAISADVIQNLKKINQHGKRADSIVKGMLDHSRSSSGIKQPTDLNKLTDEFLRLAYHGLRAKSSAIGAVPITITMVTDLDEGLPPIKLVQQDVGRVLLNVFNNAFYAVTEKAKTAGPAYKPELSVKTFLLRRQGTEMAGLLIRDNGTGIPDAIKDKIMQPFFTTKPSGEGTGLGLSLSYEIIVKAHGGSLTVTSKEGEFTQFEIILPV